MTQAKKYLLPMPCCQVM